MDENTIIELALEVLRENETPQRDTKAVIRLLLKRIKELENYLDAAHEEGE